MVPQALEQAAGEEQRGGNHAGEGQSRLNWGLRRGVMMVRPCLVTDEAGGGWEIAEEPGDQGARPIGRCGLLVGAVTVDDARERAERAQGYYH